MGIEGALSRAARSNVESAVGNIGEFTDLEVLSMTTIEELKLVNGMDLAAVLLRGKLLKKIEDEALWSFHPNQYGTLEAMAKEQGISLSELSNVKDMCFTVFPYIEETLGLNIAQIWENVGKSNMRELVPVLKAMITGEVSRGSVQAAVDRFLNDAAATEATVAEEEGRVPDVTPENIRRLAVGNLMAAGEMMTNTAVRQHIRPEHTTSIETTVLKSNGRRFIMAEVDEDQYLMFQRKMGTGADIQMFDLPDDLRARRVEAARVPMYRRIQSLTE